MGGGGARRPRGGLPFGGIPSELQEGVDKLLATEPEHAEPDIVFTHQPSDARSDAGSRCGGCLSEHPAAGSSPRRCPRRRSSASSNQAGPKLTESASTTA